MTPEWEIQNAGWHTSELGGVAKERDRRWYFYPMDDSQRHGPFNTCAQAKAAALLPQPRDTTQEKT